MHQTPTGKVTPAILVFTWPPLSRKSFVSTNTGQDSTNSPPSSASSDSCSLFCVLPPAEKQPLAAAKRAAC